MLYEELSGTVIGAAMEVHKLLGSGFLESVYERALALELTGRQIPFERQAPITVMYKQAQVGEYRADFLVGGKIILEIKATAALIAEHHARALHYLPRDSGWRCSSTSAPGRSSSNVSSARLLNPCNPCNPWRF